MNRIIFSDRQCIGFFSLIAAALLAGAASLAHAQTPLMWNGATDNWSSSADWVANPTYNGQDTLNPGYNGAVINSGGVVTINSNVTDPTGMGFIFIGGSDFLGGGGGNGTVNMTGGTLNTCSTTPGLQEFLGVNSGSGIFTQSGGINCPYQDPAPSGYQGNNPGSTGSYNRLSLGYSPGGYGEYDLSGGSLGVNAIFAGASVEMVAPDLSSGTGVFNQTGGSVGRFAVGTLVKVQAIGLMLGGAWDYQNYSSSPVSMTSVGNYNLSGASSLLVGGVESIGNTGTGNFVQSGGTNAIVGGGTVTGVFQANTLGNGSADYDNNIGALLLGFYGAKEAGNQRGYQGNGVGNYTLTGGLLTGPANSTVPQGSAGLEVIGVSGTGTFVQSGGTNVPSWGLYLGGFGATTGIVVMPTTGGSGIYTLSGGLLDVPPTSNGIGGAESLGYRGSAVFNQTGGTNVTPEILFGGKDLPATGSGAEGRGTYNLGGGLLVTGKFGFNVQGNLNDAAFNFTGGTLQASGGSLDNVIPTVVGTAASNVATVDSNGQIVDINGVRLLTGLGQLAVIDSAGGGTVVLGGTNNQTGIQLANLYSGGTTVLSGTLEVLYPTALPTTGILTVGSPTAVVLSAQAGTMFGSDAVGQAAAVGTTGVDIASAAPAADTPVAFVAGSVGNVPLGSGGPVPEPSTLLLLSIGLLSLWGYARRR